MAIPRKIPISKNSYLYEYGVDWRIFSGGYLVGYAFTDGTGAWFAANVRFPFDGEDVLSLSGYGSAREATEAYLHKLNH